MPDEPAGPPLPCLKEHAWAGRDDAVCRPLWDGKRSDHMPWIGFGYDHPHTFEFISTAQLLFQNVSRDALERQALIHLHARAANWQPLETGLGGGNELRMLVCADDFFAAEQILNPEAMRHAQRTLQAPALLVGVPRRGVLFATAADQDPLAIATFGGLIARQFARADTAPISPLVFTMNEGAIVGATEPPPGTEEERQAQEDAEDDEEQDEGAPYINAIVVRGEGGKEEIHLTAGGGDGDRLARGIESAFLALVSEHASRHEFSGHIRIVILGMTPRPARKQIPPLLEHLRGVCAESSTPEKPLRVSLTYQREDSWGASTGTPPAEAPRPFAWWTGLPWWVRILVGLLIGFLILFRIIVDMVASWR